MEVNYFQILLIDDTFYIQHVHKVVLNVLIEKWKPQYNQDRWLKG